MKGLIAVIVVLIVLGGGYYWYTQNQASTGTESASDDFGMTVDQSNTDAMDNTGTNASGDTSGSAGTNVNVNVDATVSTGTKEFTVTNAGMTFTEKSLSVQKGDTVKITFKNTGGTHDFRVDGYNVGTKVINNGQSETFEFTADKAGTFEYYCSVGQHRQLGMKGTLTVR